MELQTQTRELETHDDDTVVEGMVDDATEATEGVAGDVMDGAEQGVDDGEVLLDDAAETGGDMADDAGVAIEGAADDATDMAEDGMEATEEMAEDTAVETEAWLKMVPLLPTRNGGRHWRCRRRRWRFYGRNHG